MPNVNKIAKGVTGGVTITTSSTSKDEGGDAAPEAVKPKSDNACRRLYEKASVDRNMKESWRKEEQDKKVSQTCTFSPDVSGSIRRAKKAGGGRAPPAGDSKQSVFERLQRKNFITYERERDENLTFKPKILEKKVRSWTLSRHRPIAHHVDYTNQFNTKRRRARNNR